MQQQLKSEEFTQAGRISQTKNYQEPKSESTQAGVELKPIAL
jgi:hypothetical protein